MNRVCSRPTSNRHLTDRFKERQGLDVTHGAADFNQHDIMAFTAFDDALFDFIGDMRDNLNGRAQIIAPALFAQDVCVDTAGGEVVAPAHGGADETLVVTQIQIGFGAVVGDEHFAVLEWTHGAWIHVDVRVQLHAW